MKCLAHMHRAPGQGGPRRYEHRPQTAGSRGAATAAAPSGNSLDVSGPRARGTSRVSERNRLIRVVRAHASIGRSRASLRSDDPFVTAWPKGGEAAWGVTAVAFWSANGQART